MGLAVRCGRPGGRYVENTRRRTGLLQGIDYFEQAIREDPNYALAYAGLADSYSLLAWYRFLPPREAFPKASAAAAKSLEVDENLPEAHTSTGVVNFYYEWDWAATKRALERAIELNPRDATARHSYAEYLSSQGRLDAAVAMMEEARRIDPLSLTVNAGLGWVYYFCRRYLEAIRHLEQTLELNPEYVFLNWFLGQAYLMNGMHDEAIGALRRGLAGSDDHPGMAAYLGHACAVAGRADDARDLLRVLEERSRTSYVPADYLSVVHIGLGEHDEAIQCLKRACDERALHLVFLAIDPIFDPLRPHPGFGAILDTVGLEHP